MTVLRATTTDSRDRAGFVSLVSAQWTATEFSSAQWNITAPDPGIVYPGDLYVQVFGTTNGSADTAAGGYPTLGTQLFSGSDTSGSEPRRFVARAFSPTVAQAVGSASRIWHNFVNTIGSNAFAASLVFSRFRNSGSIAADVVSISSGAEATAPGAALRTVSRSEPRVLAVGLTFTGLGFTGGGALSAPDNPLWRDAASFNDPSQALGFAVETRTFTERGTTVQPERTIANASFRVGAALFHIRAP